MNKNYVGRINAIRIMLHDLSCETRQEGYDLLFKLWLDNTDSEDFNQQLILIAREDHDMLDEFERRINEIVTRDSITDLYLRGRFKKLISEVTISKPDALRGRDEELRVSQTPTKTLKKSNKEKIMKPSKSRAKMVFISYSHKDENFKDELVTMLAGLQRQGIIDAWQDRRIEPGDDWYTKICEAMENCNLAVLLISSDFIASRFIQEKELTYLFQKRVEEGLRVVPIIVRSCLWQSEPALRKLQALPKDGKPVISFSKESGDRDQIWTDIGKAIAELAHEL